VFATWNTFDPILPGTFGLAAGYALLIAALSTAGKTIAMPTLRPLRYLGDISYTLYLQHMMVFHGLLWIAASAGFADLSTHWPYVALSLAASIAMAAITSRFLERDMLKLFVAVCRTAWAEPAALVAGRRAIPLAVASSRPAAA
jgi:peptidoglycan/LPS O-acetylase OafA/YrhL